MFKGHIRKRSTKSGHTWQVVVECGENPINGKRERIFKAVPGTKKDAEKMMAQIIKELEVGVDFKESEITVQEYLKRWMKDYCEVNLEQKTIDGYNVNIEKYINPAIGKHPIQNLKPMHVQTMYTSLLGDGLSPRTVQYVHRTLHKALDSALRMQIVSKNVADLVTSPRVKKYQSEVYTQDELIEFLKRIKYTDVEVPFTLAAMLGLRRGEVIALKWEDVDFVNKNITIKRSAVPTSKGVIIKSPKSENGIRTIEISDSLIKLLKRHQKRQKENKLKCHGNYEDNDYICCREDGQLFEPGHLSKKFKRFLEKNKLKPIRLHDLRYTNATLMLKHNIPAKIASQRLGHSGIGITLDLYSHVTGDMQKVVADKFEDEILSKVQ